jgi:hypothetical protein
MDEQVAFFQVDAAQAANPEPAHAGRAALRQQAAGRASLASAAAA